MTTPLTKTARQSRIIELLGRNAVHSQSELARLLADAGVDVTQATLSRDLVDIGAVKLRAADGSLIYAVPGEGGDALAAALLALTERRADPAPRTPRTEIEDQVPSPWGPADELPRVPAGRAFAARPTVRSTARSAERRP